MRPQCLRSAALAALLALVPLENAAAQGATDLVELRDGTVIHGTLVEQSAERTVVMLPDGSVRTLAVGEVRRAVPGGVRAEPVPPPPPAAPPNQARLRVTTDDAALTLHRSVQQQSIGGAYGTLASGRVDEFNLLCNAPCELDLAPGTYQFGVARASRDVLRAGARVTVPARNLELHLRYDDRSELRLAGYLTLGFGLAGGVALTLVGTTDEDFFEPMVFTALGFYVVGGVVGLVLVMLNDSADAELRF